MATTEHFYTGNNSTTSFAFTFPYLSNDAVKVELDNVLKTENSSGQTNNDYTISNTNIVFNSAPGSGVSVHIYRNTNVDSAQAQYAAGSSIRAADLNNNQTQLLYAAQEENQQIQTTGIQDGAVTSAKIKDGTISNADINGSAAIEGSKLQASSGSVAGSMSSANFTKLAGIETAATADQTAAEIRTLVESATDSNVFTDADHTKLNGIEASATADQTNSEIKTAYEANSDTNAFTDAEKTKLTNIATGADVTSSNSINALSDVNTSGVQDGKILKYQASSSSFIIADDTGGSQGATTFTGLTDTPANYSNAANKTLKINSSGNAIEFVDVSTDIVNDTTPQLGGNLDVQANEINTSTTNGNITLNPNGTGVVEIKGDLTFNDNIKAIFGTGSDLEIYHDGNQSVIKDVGTGQLLISGQNTIAFTNSAGNENYARMLSNGAVELYHDNVKKAETSATGFDVTGNITATGVIHATGNQIKVEGATPKFTLIDGNNNPDYEIQNNGGTLNINDITTGTTRFSIDSAGTISIDGNVLPTTDSTHDIGTNTVRWRNLYADTLYGDGSNLTGVSGGATGGNSGANAIFWENENTVTHNYTIQTNYNAGSFGPLTINNGVTVTVPNNSVWTIV